MEVETTESGHQQPRFAYLRGVIRRWIWFTVLIVALFVITTTLAGIWSPLAWAVPITATIAVAVLVWRALTDRWSG
jgi:hypothetical protein